MDFLHFIKRITKKFPIYSILRTFRNELRQKKIHRDWKKAGRPVPTPPVAKPSILKSYARKYKLNVLIETGTYMGDMIWAMRKKFKYIYSIELSKELYDKAKDRFSNIKNVKLIHGDSGKHIENILNRVDHPALFWLDAHYSEGITARGETDTPILDELHHILRSNVYGHVILIDDAREFGIDPAYPTVDELKEYVFSIRDDVKLLIKDDIIRITPLNE